MYPFAPLRSSVLALGLIVGGTMTAGIVANAQAPRVATGVSEMAPIINRVRLSGTVVSPRTAQLSSDLGGLVEDVLVDLGDRVAAGDPLIQLDASLEGLQLRSAEASTREAQEELADAERRVRIARRLAENDNLPQNELDAREAALRIAEAKADRLESEEERFRARVERHTITAPFAGVITSRSADAGEWIDPGDTVVELVDVDHLRVDAAVPQRHFPELDEDPDVTLRFDALPDREVDAEVVARVPLSDPTARTFTLRLAPSAEGIPLTPGMSARVVIRLDTGERGVVIPRDALMRYPDGRTTVWVTQRDGENVTVEEQQVELGRAFNGRIHVRSGLEAGTRIVVRGNESLQPGQRVRVTNEGT
ncbi:MAG: efflux RND transporter periplasmic adaptor subunit [Dichotomicrobium sp.]